MTGVQVAADIFRKLDLRLNRRNGSANGKTQGKKLPVYFPFPLVLLSISPFLIFHFLRRCFRFPLYFLFPPPLPYISPLSSISSSSVLYFIPRCFQFPLPSRSISSFRLSISTFPTLVLLFAARFSSVSLSLFFYAALLSLPRSPLASPPTQFRSETRRRESTEHRPGQ